MGITNFYERDFSNNFRVLDDILVNSNVIVIQLDIFSGLNLTKEKIIISQCTTLFIAKDLIIESVNNLKDRKSQNDMSIISIIILLLGKY